MTCNGSELLHTRHLPVGSRSRRILPGVLPLLAIALSAQPVWAATAPQEALPTVTITTTTAALAADPPTRIGDGTGIAADAADVADAPARTKPAAHRASRFQVQTIDTASLAAPVSATAISRVPGVSAMVIEARATTLRPAPLPDQDVDAPGPDAQTLEAQQQASVAPSFYGNKDHFSGDGFAAGSNLESDKNNRRRPGGGMSLSIPVQ